MIVSGELENVPLLDVFQVLAFSSQTGALSVEAGDITGTVLFDSGGIVCGESPATRQLLARAAREVEPQTRRALRRVQALACLTELLSLRKGSFRFTKHDQPMPELGGVDTRTFYAAGSMATADLLLVLATSIDKKEAAAAPSSGDPSGARAHPRFSPTLIEADIRLEGSGSTLSGHLTNLSAGGAFFQGDALPEKDTMSELTFQLTGLGTVTAKARVAWVRQEAIDGERGVGLAFEGLSEDARAKLREYLDRFQQLATDMDLAG